MLYFKGMDRFSIGGRGVKKPIEPDGLTKARNSPSRIFDLGGDG